MTRSFNPPGSPTAPPPNGCPNCGHTEIHTPGIGCLADAEGGRPCPCPDAWEPPTAATRGRRAAQPIPTLTLARAERDQALARLQASSRWNEFQSHIWSAILLVGDGGREWTTDDIWTALAETDYTDRPDPRALGGMLMKLIHARLIIWTGEYRQSVRRHASPIKVYRLSGVR